MSAARMGIRMEVREREDHRRERRRRTAAPRPSTLSLLLILPGVVADVEVEESSGGYGIRFIWSPRVDRRAVVPAREGERRSEGKTKSASKERQALGNKESIRGSVFAILRGEGVYSFTPG